MTTVAELYGHEAVEAYSPPSVAATGSNPGLLMGMEIEAEHMPHADRWYRDRIDTLGWNVTTDGSLRGQNNERRAGIGFEPGNAYEFVSRPMRQADLIWSVRAFMQATGITQDAFSSDRTSIHVHVNCQDKDFGFIRSLVYLYAVMEQCIFQFIGHDRANNIYCVPLSSTNLLNRINGFLRSPDNLAGSWIKYTSLNFCPLSEYGTVEFRHMHGTTDVEKLTKWMNIIGRLFRKAEMPFKDLREEIFSLNTTSAYERLFRDIFADDVPYDQAYVALLEEGVLAAKLTEAKVVAPVRETTVAAAPGGLWRNWDEPEVYEDIVPPPAARVNVAPELQGFVNQLIAERRERDRRFLAQVAAAPAVPRPEPPARPVVRNNNRGNR